ncbi:hypothetical protein Vadar_016960 [Vaccinium darrowii]|uniref:Uncharacterized protein n=1 Tax=Vaccinium darrowii TaxID=229202 RepID=A0ACB7Z5S2_9ERIC|nr:hypothetical protein Vadar_016960 [Vaccinium darrowii]
MNDSSKRPKVSPPKYGLSPNSPSSSLKQPMSSLFAASWSSPVGNHNCFLKGCTSVDYISGTKLWDKSVPVASETGGDIVDNRKKFPNQDASFVVSPPVSLAIGTDLSFGTIYCHDSIDNGELLRTGVTTVGIRVTAGIEINHEFAGSDLKAIPTTKLAAKPKWKRLHN